MKRMTKGVLITGLIILDFIILFCFTSCKKNSCEEQPREDCFCTEEYDPVCGCNGKTYGNACEAACHGITKFTKGECK